MSKAVSYRAFSGILSVSLMLLACSQAVNQNTTLVLNKEPQRGTPRGDFAALSGGGLDPTVEVFCSKGDINGDKGLARSSARSYREHLKKLISLTTGGQGHHSGSIWGGDVKPSSSPTPSPMATYSPTASATASPTASATAMASATATSFATATSDISVVEKTQLNGKIFDQNNAPVDGATIRARSINSTVPFDATTTSSGGSYAFNNAPSGVQIEILATIPGFATRRRVEVLKSNKTGDPNANRYDFGNDGSGSTFGVGYNSLSDQPEVVRILPGRNAYLTSPPTELSLTFNEPMDRTSVESGLILQKRINTTTFDFEQVLDISAFDIIWNADDTEIKLKLKAGINLVSQTTYRFSFKTDAMIKDKAGNARSGRMFKLTDGDYESFSQFNIQNFRTLALPEPSYAPLPPALKERDHYYFSYDDSASVAAVELTKHAIDNGRLPDPAWARTWEFLNYEPFDHVEQESSSDGRFKVSLGLWRYDDANPFTQTYEVGAHVTAPFQCKETRQNLNMTILIDISGSMEEPAALEAPENGKVPTKMELVKEGLKQLQSSLKPGDVLHVVEFTNKPNLELENYVVGNDSPQKWDDLIGKLRGEGSTNLQSAIEAAYRQAQKLYDTNKLNRVLLMTDARPTEGQTDMNLIRSEAAKNNRNGIYLSALGIGHTHDQELLNQMTEAGRGAYYTIQTRADIKEAMRDRFIPLISVIARNVRFKLEFPGWLHHGKTAAEQISGDPAKVQPTNFSANTSQFFWEQFKANKTDFRGNETVKLTLSYQDPLSGNLHSEIFTKTLDQILGKDLGNIKSAHLIQLTTALIRKEVTVDQVNGELTGLLRGVGE